MVTPCARRAKIAPTVPSIALLFAATDSASATKMVLVRKTVTSKCVAMGSAVPGNLLAIATRIAQDHAASIRAGTAFAMPRAASRIAIVEIVLEPAATASVAMACAMELAAKARATAMPIAPARAA